MALEDDDDDDMDITTKSHIINANPTTDNIDVKLKAVNMLDFIQTKAKRTKPSFRKSNQSNDTYHSASIAGHRKVDIQATLSVVTPNQQ